MFHAADRQLVVQRRAMHGYRIVSYLVFGVVGCNAQFLEEAATWSRVVRLAGSGTGAMVATLLTLGYNSHQLEQLLNFDIRKFTRGTLYINN